MKYDALSLSFAGDKYLGTPYSQMDCQKFVEKCMHDCGLHKDLPGSNAWYRECIKNGWTGTPEEAMRLFGQIPKGALLFILEKDGQEPEKYRGDGIGNASHIGIKTGRNDGAIHSSSSRGCVATSKFKDKTIPNGGWNRIGLLSYFSYDKSINWYFDHTAIGEKPAENNKEEQTMVDAIIKSKNGGKVNLRAGKSKKSDRIAEIPSESKVQFIEGAEGWSKIQWEGKTGWVMSEFVYGEDDLPAEDPNDFEPVNDGTDQSGSEKVTLTFTVEELAFMLPILQSMTDQIISKVGRG